jgi:hypothetical protein
VDRVHKSWLRARVMQYVCVDLNLLATLHRAIQLTLLIPDLDGRHGPHPTFVSPQGLDPTVVSPGAIWD